MEDFEGDNQKNAEEAAGQRHGGPVGPDDERLFLEKCVGPTFDVGCGPGRLAGAPAGIGLVSERVRLRVGSVASVPFGWANVGVDAIEAIVETVGLCLTYVHEVDGRHVATLTTPQPRHPQGAKR